MKTLARTASLLAFIALLAMLGLHALAALFWGSWDHDGLGSLGFWSVWLDGLKARWWVYLILMSVIFAAAIHMNRNNRTANNTSDGTR